MDYSLVWLELALDDLQNLHEYYADAASEDVANKILQKIFKSVQYIKTAPHLGKPSPKNADIRELIIPQNPYVVPYRVKNQTIEILRVFDGRQNPINSWV
jgi:toxin ParE1/3/4